MKAQAPGVGFPDESCATIVDVLRWRAENQRNRIAYTFLAGQDDQEINITYGDLDRKARAIAVLLRSFRLRKKTALLLLPSGPEHVIAFFGCLYGGVVPIPGLPVRAGTGRRAEVWFRSVSRDADSGIAFVDGGYAETFKRQLNGDSAMSSVTVVSTSDARIEDAFGWRRPHLRPESLAFVQYTSGSTSLPKGVMINHANIMHNQRGIQTAFGQSERSVIVSWLPLHHDMGLVGSILQPAYLGARSVLLSPARFLQSPASWLRAISVYRGTSSSAPNFAYELCCSKVSSEEKQDIDLTSWAIAVNGAEPVRFETMKQFAENFSDCGFRMEAFRPSYGLAEATLMVTGQRDPELPLALNLSVDALGQGVAKIARDGEHSKFAVGCGLTVLGNKVQIVDPKSLKAKPANSVGEIWVAGPSISCGYKGPSQDNESVSWMRVKGQIWLRTGDLGFISDGQLFVTGRLKDLIIVRGRNLYPHDIEWTAVQACGGGALSCASAFAVDAEGREELVVISEVRHGTGAGANSVINAIRQAIALDHGIVVHKVALVKRGALPKTTSGKIKRKACRNAFLRGEFKVIASESYATVGENAGKQDGSVTREFLLSLEPEIRQEFVESRLQTEVSRLVGVGTGEIGITKPIIGLGLDSLGASELVAFLKSNLAVDCDPTILLDGCSLAELAEICLDRLKQDRTFDTRVPVAKNESGTAIPLSYGQQALWSLYKLFPNSSAYNIAGAGRVRSECNPSILRLALQGVMAQHEALRTVFRIQGGDVVQFVKNANEIDIDSHFEYKDISHGIPNLTGILMQESRRLFVLEQAPPVRLLVFKETPSDHVVLLVMHHIISDFRSVSIILRSLGRQYSALRSGRETIHTSLNAPYSEFVTWQRELLDSARGDELKRFWTAELSPDVPSLKLSYPQNLDAMVNNSAAMKRISLEPNTYARVRTLARRLEMTPFTVLLSAFLLSLHRTFGQDDLAAAVPIDGRTNPRFSDTVGYFVNAVAVRSRYRNDLDYSAFLEETRRTVVGAMRHQDCPFSVAIGKVHPRRILGTYPVCQAMCLWQKSRAADCEGLEALSLGSPGTIINTNDCSLESIEFEPTGSTFPLTLLMTESQGNLLGSLKYNLDLVDEGVIQQFSDELVSSVDAIVKNAEVRTDRVSAVGERDRHYAPRLLQCAEPARSSAGRRVPELFEDQVVRQPDAPALIFRETKLTFAELNARANQFARYLRAMGVSCESRVGLCLDRSVELIIALLGIWKAGGAFVAMDSSDPKDRIACVIQDSSMGVLITHEKLLDRLPDQLPQTVLLDIDLDFVCQGRRDNLLLEIPEESLAYVIFTSGSTGKPKGVMVEHRSLSNLTNGLQSALYGESAKERLVVGLNAPLVFDSSVKQLIALALGNTLCLLPDECRRDAHAFREYVEENLVDVVDCTPTQLQLLIEMGLKNVPNTMCLLVGGELIGKEAWDWLSRSSPARCYNLYGPTECTVDATLCLIQKNSKESIGKALSGTQVFLLDDDLCPIRAGATGELFIGGASVARGYLQCPESTAERFLPDPFSSMPGGRLYRTGDRGEWTMDGTIKVLGRIDRQVKVRGYRVELAEVERALSEYAGVSAAAVIARAKGDGTKQLLGYVVSSESRTSDEYRRFLAQKIPGYMVPAVVVAIDRIPTNNNGKREYSALPIPEELKPDGLAQVSTQVSGLESALLELWSDALPARSIGINDNFFALGGDSLQATRLITRIQDRFQFTRPLLPLFFQDPTIAGLAKVLAAKAQPD